MSYVIVLVVTSMQPERGNSRCCTAREQLRVQRFMARASATLPASVEVDSAHEWPRPHTSIGNRKYAASGNSTNDKLALVNVTHVSDAAHYIVHVLDRPLETRNRYFRIARVAGAIRSKSFTVVAARLPPASPLREQGHPAAIREITRDDCRADRSLIDGPVETTSRRAVVEDDRWIRTVLPGSCNDYLKEHPWLAGLQEDFLNPDVSRQRPTFPDKRDLV